MSYVPAENQSRWAVMTTKQRVLPREAERIISGASKVVAIAVTM